MTLPADLFVGDQVRFRTMPSAGLATIYDFRCGGSIALLNQVRGTTMIKLEAVVADLVKVPRQPQEQRP